MKNLFFSFIPVVLTISLNDAVAQSSYRITPEGRYQYIENPDVAFDETKGIFYKDITMRSFYLETKRLGFIPDKISYEDFSEMSINEQRSLLTQNGLPDCSSSRLTYECLVFTPRVFNHRNDHAQVMDLSKKCRRVKYGKDSLSEAGKMVVSPGELPECDEQNIIH